MFTPVYPIILASGSPRRKELLEQAGLLFAVSAPDAACEPLPFPQESPLHYAMRSALAKACSVASVNSSSSFVELEQQLVCDLQASGLGFQGVPTAFQALRQLVQQLPLQTFLCTESVDSLTSTIISADTIVVVDQNILGKPRNPAEALSMLKLLRGRSHNVFTACSVVAPTGIFCFTLASEVAMWAVPDKALLAYVATGESFDKAGGYAIQGIGAFLIEAIKGSWTNVVGLPVAELLQIMLSSGLLALNDECSLIYNE